MTLIDKDIRALIESQVLRNADPAQVSSVSYDLRTKYYAQGEDEFRHTFELSPGESVFVACEEIVHMPGDMIGRIVLRNSRIRAGLALEAPVYQPGHETRLFFRITNISEKPMKLDSDAQFASIMFEQLEHAPEKTYAGAFQEELDFRNLGAYRRKYKMELQDYQDKADSLRSIEKNIYGTVLTLLSVFVALFSLININIELAYAEAVDITRMIVFNLSTIGCIAFLTALIRIPERSRRKADFWGLLITAAVLLAAAVCIAL